MFVVRTDKYCTIIVHDGNKTSDTINAYSYAARQRKAGRIVHIADCWNNVQLDIAWTILYKTDHWTTFLDYVASVLWPHEELRGGY